MVRRERVFAEGVGDLGVALRAVRHRVGDKRIARIYVRLVARAHLRQRRPDVLSVHERNGLLRHVGVFRDGHRENRVRRDCEVLEVELLDGELLRVGAVELVADRGELLEDLLHCGVGVVPEKLYKPQHVVPQHIGNFAELPEVVGLRLDPVEREHLLLHLARGHWAEIQRVDGGEGGDPRVDVLPDLGAECVGDLAARRSLAAGDDVLCDLVARMRDLGFLHRLEDASGRQGRLRRNAQRDALHRVLRKHFREGHGLGGLLELPVGVSEGLGDLLGCLRPAKRLDHGGLALHEDRGVDMGLQSEVAVNPFEHLVYRPAAADLPYAGPHMRAHVVGGDLPLAGNVPAHLLERILEAPLCEVADPAALRHNPLAEQPAGLREKLVCHGDEIVRERPGAAGRKYERPDYALVVGPVVFLGRGVVALRAHLVREREHVVLKPRGEGRVVKAGGELHGGAARKLQPERAYAVVRPV